MNNIDMNIDIKDLCTHCGRDTSFGSGNGLFVNRIPSGADVTLMLEGHDVALDVTIDGYMCPECQAVECDECGDSFSDLHEFEEQRICIDCRDKLQLWKETT